MIELRGVTRRYRLGGEEITALQNVDLTISDGDYVAILGPSGSGKSTLLNLAGLLDSPTEGKVLIDSQDVGALSAGRRAHLRLTALGFVFQAFHLTTTLTAIENVAVPLESVGVGARDRFRRSSELLESVGLGNRKHFLPERLSGGERQRVAICRALANQPRVLLADEPTGQLHSEDRSRVIELFGRANAAGRTVVMVTHDPDMAAAAHRIIRIRDGRIEREDRR